MSCNVALTDIFTLLAFFKTVFKATTPDVFLKYDALGFLGSRILIFKYVRSNSNSRSFSVFLVISSIHFDTILLLVEFAAFAHKELFVHPTSTSHPPVMFSKVSLCDLIGLVFLGRLSLSGSPASFVLMFSVISDQRTSVLSTQLQ